MTQKVGNVTKVNFKPVNGSRYGKAFFFTQSGLALVAIDYSCCGDFPAYMLKTLYRDDFVHGYGDLNGLLVDLNRYGAYQVDERVAMP